ncbi:hypothetical protein OROGR_026844 [Orobanche gracilis]
MFGERDRIIQDRTESIRMIVKTQKRANSCQSFH